MQCSVESSLIPTFRESPGPGALGSLQANGRPGLADAFRQVLLLRACRYRGVERSPRAAVDPRREGTLRPASAESEQPEPRMGRGYDDTEDAPSENRELKTEDGDQGQLVVGVMVPDDEPRELDGRVHRAAEHEQVGYA